MAAFIELLTRISKILSRVILAFKEMDVCVRLPRASLGHRSCGILPRGKDIFKQWFQKRSGTAVAIPETIVATPSTIGFKSSPSTAKVRNRSGASNTKPVSKAKAIRSRCFRTSLQICGNLSAYGSSRRNGPAMSRQDAPQKKRMGPMFPAQIFGLLPSYTRAATSCPREARWTRRSSASRPPARQLLPKPGLRSREGNPRTAQP